MIARFILGCSPAKMLGALLRYQYGFWVIFKKILQSYLIYHMSYQGLIYPVLKYRFVTNGLKLNDNLYHKVFAMKYNSSIDSEL